MTKTKRQSEKTGVSLEEFLILSKEGEDERLTGTGAAFHACMCRLLGVPVRPLNDESAKFVNELDTFMRERAKEDGIEIY